MSGPDVVNFFAAPAVFIIGIIGVVCNFFIIIAFKKDRANRNSFNLICVFRAFVNLYVLITTFLFCFLPIIILGHSPFNPILETALIVFSNTFYLGNEYQTILVAVNRFFAIFFPIQYSRLFGFRSTLTALCLIYGYRFLALFRDVVFYVNKNDKQSTTCSIHFSPEKLAVTDGCATDDHLLLVVSITFLIVTIFNVANFVKILKFKRLRKTNGKHTSRAEKRNTVLFVQTVLQDALYLVDTTFTFQLSGLSHSKAWSFVSGTFVWECLHTFDGLIMLMFNERYTLLKTLFRLHSTFPVIDITQTTRHPLPRV